MKKTLLSTALLLGALAAPAFAGSYGCGKDCPVSGYVGAGYMNYYSFHNVVPTSGWLDSGITGVAASLKYEIPETIDLVAEFTHSKLDGMFNDSTSVFAGIQGQPQWMKGLTLSLGYSLYDGGYAGFMSDMRRLSKSNGWKDPFAGSDMDHQITLRALYEVPESGLFYKGSVSYSFNGTEGWLMDVGMGYKWDVNNCISAVIAGDVSFSQGYMTGLNNSGYGQKFNGVDGYSLTIMFPIKASEAVTITPFAGGVWAGHNSIAYNKFTQNYNWGRAFKNFAPIGGVAVTWSF